MEVLQPSARIEQAEERRIHERHAKIATLAYFLSCCGGRRNGTADVDGCISRIYSRLLHSGLPLESVKTLDV